MHAEALIIGVLFTGLFLAITAALQSFVRRSNVPYTVALLVCGFIGQYLLEAAGLHNPLSLESDLIYFVLLPLLLYESAFHINFHQFQLQFKTITFLATFGVLLATGTVAFLLSQFLGMDPLHGLLFGALISATDPIAVLALFKELGAPKRLGLLAEGESMFNDATAVILFRLISGFVVADQLFATVDLAYSLLDFTYVFIGSMGFGFVAAYATSLFISNIKNDRLVETTMTIALALITFVAAEHFFGLSGVIATVAAGLTMGNIGRTNISSPVISFMEELWEYIGFISVSLVFFFAGLDLDLAGIIAQPYSVMLVILAVLISRAVSTYVTFFLTNTIPFFKNEPNVFLKWQHVLNWGGLRGVIPLVLVYSLPQDFVLREEFIAYTLATFLFTMLVNATTIRKLLMKLGLHLPKREEEIIQEETNIFTIQEAKHRLEQLSDNEFSRVVLKDVQRTLSERERKHQKRLAELATPRELEKSLRLEVLEIERKTINRLFEHEHISANVLNTFKTELDLQQDALEYPELYAGRGYRAGGRVDSQETFLGRLARLRESIQNFPLPFIQSWLIGNQKNLIMSRLSLLQARIVASSEAILYLEHVADLLDNDKQALRIIDSVKTEHEQFRLKNSFQMQIIERNYSRLFQEFERRLVETLAWKKDTANSTSH
ncbi:sodium:proton antiporter [Candidatus Woesebacteria bacterium]|nr:sodium:proton antiporter [Candidatus Woesebacteria bacterium]MCD8507575.1 sodium:proton antiporter [Candidatus Woesebacteria bacterium]MCD8527415.1 sodium:proton antiporter [Candidatus Woesebacteria bacterium]MCD8546162.1 sodium:proton antiporter [Candidatus Woesebacteria bacterium]